MTPCTCGYQRDPRRECECHWEVLETYRCRVPGPLLDRIELHVDCPAITMGEMRGPGDETSEQVWERVTAARERQHDRQGRLNSRLSFDDVDEVAALESTARRILGQAFESLGLSGRAAHSMMQVAQTLADLEGREAIGAVQYRALERRSEEATP
jgi:magnesium chelatase family protein